jgi:hypothetical protein
LIELEGTREKLDKEKIAFKMVSFINKPNISIAFFYSFQTVFGRFSTLINIFVVFSWRMKKTWTARSSNGCWKNTTGKKLFFYHEGSDEKEEKREMSSLIIWTRISKELKVHKREKFFSSDFEFFTILYLVKLKY